MRSGPRDAERLGERRRRGCSVGMREESRGRAEPALGGLGGGGGERGAGAGGVCAALPPKGCSLAGWQKCMHNFLLDAASVLLLEFWLLWLSPG